MTYKLVYVRGMKGPAPELWGPDRLTPLSGKSETRTYHEVVLTEEERGMELRDLEKRHPFPVAKMAMYREHVETL